VNGKQCQGREGTAGVTANICSAPHGETTMLRTPSFTPFTLTCPEHAAWCSLSITAWQYMIDETTDHHQAV
jgi:hypothetical protein